MGASTVVVASPAEELTKRLPDGVIGFVATSGGDALKGDFGKTALGRIWNDPNVQSFYDTVKLGLLAKLKQPGNDPNAMQKADLVTRYAQLILSRPLLIGVAQTPPAKAGPPVCAFAIVEAGDRKTELTAAVSKLEALVGRDTIVDREVGSLKMRSVKASEGVPLYWGWVENRFVLGFNDAQGVAVKYLAAPRGAATAASLSKLPAGDDALVVYYDYQKLGQLLGALAQEKGHEEQLKLLQAVFKGIGLAEAKAAFRVGFAGSDLVAHGAIELPTPPTGVFAALKPIDPAWFRAVDVRAVTATATNCDVASLYDTVMNIVKTAAPDTSYLQLRKAIVDLEADAKLRIREGLLASLAGPALFYTLPAGTITEAPRGGLVLVAKLKDAPLFEKTMSALGEFAAGKSNGSLQVTSQKREGGRTVQVWTIAPLLMLGLTPAWSLANDHVVIGSNVELCDLGAKQLASKGADGKSLLDAEGFKKVTAGLPKEVTSLTYTDSRVQLTQTMMQIQQFWPMAAMFAMQAGVNLPPSLPPLANIAKDLGPSCSYRYWASDGLHVYYRGPGIEVSEMSLIGGAVGAAVALPAMAKARDKARNTVVIANLKQIGVALHMYAQEHQGEWPADLEQAKSYLGSSRVLESPRKPKDFSGPSYLYVRGQPQKPDPQNVMVYENPEYCTENIDVLFADGRVEAMKPDAFRRALQATYDRLGKEMPEVRFKGETGTKPRAPRPPRPGKAPQT